MPVSRSRQIWTPSVAAIELNACPVPTGLTGRPAWEAPVINSASSPTVPVWATSRGALVTLRDQLVQPATERLLTRCSVPHPDSSAHRRRSGLLGRDEADRSVRTVHRPWHAETRPDRQPAVRRPPPRAAVSVPRRRLRCEAAEVWVASREEVAVTSPVALKRWSHWSTRVGGRRTPGRGSTSSLT